jgi:hypothetical protein
MKILAATGSHGIKELGVFSGEGTILVVPLERVEAWALAPAGA